MDKAPDKRNKKQPSMEAPGTESCGGTPGDAHLHSTDDALSFPNEGPKGREGIGAVPKSPGRPRAADRTDVTGAALAAGTAASLLFVLGAAPGITWLDSSELAAAAFGLGIAHPPGHPLPSMLGHFLLTWLPLGSIAFRCVLASALAMGLAVGSLVWVAAWLFDAILATWIDQETARPSQGVRTWLTLLPAALFAVTPAVWIQSVRVEVYATQAGLSLLSLALLGRWLTSHRTAHLAAAGLAAGLALSNHHMQALALLVPMSLLVAATSLRHQRRALLWASFVGLGLLVWLYLPLRAARDPLVNWGHPDSLDRLWWVLSTKLYFKTASRSVSQGLGLRSVRILAFLATQVSPAWAFSALLGGYLTMRRRGTLGAALLLAGLAVTSGLGAALSGFESSNPDSAAYVLLALAAVCLLAVVPFVLAAVGGAKWGGKKSLTWAALGLATLGALALGWSHFQEDRRFVGAWSASDQAFFLADSLPPGSLVLTGYHETTFLLWYQATAEGARPDVCLVFRHHLTLPGRFAQLRRRCPDLASVWVQGRMDPAGLLRLDRPVLVELDDHPADPFPRSLLPRLRPGGAFALLERGPVRGLDAPNGLNEPLAPTVTRKSPSPGLRRFLLWHAYQQAAFWTRIGRCGHALGPWREAWQLSPEDPMLVDLARRCHRALPLTRTARRSGSRILPGSMAPRP